SQVPLARFGSPQEVAHDVLHLASADVDHITGMVLHMNGGHYA
ncbi:3-oxoacyl-(acyl-carrier-protein) reductase, partial [mine drainage metagenome]